MDLEYKKFKNRDILVITYLLIQILIYSGFMVIDITDSGLFYVSNSLKFSGIILCFLFTILLPGRNNDRMDINILRAALFFTAVSDLFILILDYYLFGLVTFCIVQILYLVRLGKWRSQLKATGCIRRIINNFIRNYVTAILILAVLMVIQVKLEGLIIVSCFYFVSILFNAIDSVLIAVLSNHRNKIMFAAGMVLFLLCDINVGLFNLSDFIYISNKWFSLLYNFSAVAMWMFYLPAQVGISLSGNNNKSNYVKIHKIN